MKIRYDISPLSINSAWRGRRWKTPEYEAYETELLYKLPKKKMITGPVKVHYKFFVKNYGGRDTSNMIKLLEDILVKQGYIEDDRKVIRVSAEKIRSKEESFEVEIIAIDCG